MHPTILGYIILLHFPWHVVCGLLFLQAMCQSGLCGWDHPGGCGCLLRVSDVTLLFRARGLRWFRLAPALTPPALGPLPWGRCPGATSTGPLPQGYMCPRLAASTQSGSLGKRDKAFPQNGFQELGFNTFIFGVLEKI